MKTLRLYTYIVITIRYTSKTEVRYTVVGPLFKSQLIYNRKSRKISKIMCLMCDADYTILNVCSQCQYDKEIHFTPELRFLSILFRWVSSILKHSTSSPEVNVMFLEKKVKKLNEGISYLLGTFPTGLWLFMILLLLDTFR